jgi:hypothetical protein
VIYALYCFALAQAAIGVLVFLFRNCSDGARRWPPCRA